MEINKLVSEEYEKRLKELKKEIDSLENKRIKLLTNLAIEVESKEFEIKELEDKKHEIEGKQFYIIEKKFNGFHATFHKKDNEVKIYSEAKKDLTDAFPTLVNELKGISDSDFIVDGELVAYEDDKALGRNALMKFTGAAKSGKEVDDSSVKIHLWDITYFNKSLIDLPLRERLNYLKGLNFTNRITNTPRKVARNLNEAKNAIEWAENLANSEGAVIKKMDTPYSYGESSSWIKYRKLIEIKAVILRKNEIAGKGVNYTVGVYITEDESKKIPEKFIESINNNLVLRLGNTFNTSITEGEEGDILSLLIEEAWRHETSKGIRYSIHKPRVKDLYKEKKETSSLKELDEIVSSRGVAVSKLDKFITEVNISERLWELYSSIELAQGEEGKEVEVSNFPKQMQEDFQKIKNWNDYVVQWHLRGEESIHTDMRFKVNNHLQGITLFTPSSISKGDQLVSDAKNIRGTIKLPQPVSWLNIEERFPSGAPGTTKEHPAYFTIVGKGKYRVLEVTDHKLVFELKSDEGTVKKQMIFKGEEYIRDFNNKLPEKLKQLNGCYSYHIAHIGDRHIILFDKLKECPDSAISE